MTNYQAPHEVRDEIKLQSMIDALNAGKQLPPVIVCGEQAFTGSHRLAAWDACDMAAEVVEISNADYIAAVTKMGLDWETDTVGDYNDFCAALSAVTTDPDVRTAIADQID